MIRHLPRGALVGALAFLLLAPAVAHAYTGGGTFVVKTQFGTVVDNGGVVCYGSTGDGLGGGCLPFFFGANDTPVFIYVNDQVVGKDVAFQVCIDNNGDGICGGPDQFSDPHCFDQIFFSHEDGGKFHNALGPLPNSFLPGCAGGFPGFVVLLCEGEHQDPQVGPHTHAVTRGSIGFAAKGSGYGDFCGGGGGGTALGDNPAVAKAYTVV